LSGSLGFQVPKRAFMVSCFVVTGLAGISMHDDKHTLITIKMAHRLRFII